MKYIRKEISKGVKPIADQDFQITGDIDITGNYLVNGSPLSTNITKQENKVVATSDAQTVFTFSTAFIGYDSTTPANSDLDVYWNGARLIYGSNNDYTITANNAITLTSGTGVQTGDIIYINSRNNIILDRDYTP